MFHSPYLAAALAHERRNQLLTEARVWRQARETRTSDEPLAARLARWVRRATVSSPQRPRKAGVDPQVGRASIALVKGPKPLE